MASRADVADYVLVHGGNMSTEAWNRHTIGEPVITPDGRMGGRIWEPVIPALQDRGHRVLAPTLADEHVADLTANIEQIRRLVAEHAFDDVVLVGHSFGGMVITGVAAELGHRVRSLVYVDAALPVPGESLFDLIRAGGRDPRSFEGLEAAPPYVEVLPFDPTRIGELPKTYVRCTESDFAVVTAVATTRIATGVVGTHWSVIELPSWHVPMANMPERVSEILLGA